MRQDMLCSPKVAEKRGSLVFLMDSNRKWKVPWYGLVD